MRLSNEYCGVGPVGVRRRRTSGWGLFMITKIVQRLKQDGYDTMNRFRSYSSLTRPAATRAEAGKTATTQKPSSGRSRTRSGSTAVRSSSSATTAATSTRSFGNSVCASRRGAKRSDVLRRRTKPEGRHPIISCGHPRNDWRYDDKEPTRGRGRAARMTTTKWTRKPHAKAAIDTVITAKESEPDSPRSRNRRVRPYSADWLRQRWNEYQDNGQHRNVVGEVTELTA